LIDKTSSICLYVKLKALASWIFLSFTSFWRNSDSYEYKKVVNSVLQFMINGTTSILKSWILQICAAIYQLLLHMVFTSPK
jgi:hypothetical protein